MAKNEMTNIGTPIILGIKFPFRTGCLEIEGGAG